MSLKTVGTFDCIVGDANGNWFGESQGGTPFIRVTVVVANGDQKGATIVWYGYLTPAAIEKTVKRLCEVFGWDGDLDALYEGRTTFANKPCSIQTESEEYQGKERIKVKWLNAPNGGKAMPKEKATALIERLRGQALAIAAGGAPAADVPPDAPPKDDSDVPF